MISISHPVPELKLLNVFVGKWHTVGHIRATADSKAVDITGTDTYEWVLDGSFLLHRVDVQMGHEKNESIEMIGFDPKTKTYLMQSFDNKGGTTTMHASESNGTWVFVSDTLRFTGSFSADARVLSGNWERSGDGVKWARWMDVQLTRQK